MAAFKFKDYIPSKEKNDQIKDKINNSKEMIELRSRSFLLLKNIIESRLEDEIREHNLDARIHRPQMTFDPTNPEFNKGYSLGYKDGKMTILRYFDDYLSYLKNGIVPLFNELYAKYWDEIHEPEKEQKKKKKINKKDESMASAKKCDVCKTLFEEYIVPDVTINIYHHPYGEYRVDLCPKCQKKLELFVSGFKEALELRLASEKDGSS